MPVQTLTITDIQKLFKQKLNLKICRTSVYHYIYHKNFPSSLGLGRPRLWKKSEVLKWFARTLRG